MTKTRRLIPHTALTALAVALTACTNTPSGGPDSTPPGAVSLQARLETPGRQADVDFTNADADRSALSADTKLRLIALLGDPESGIRTVVMGGELFWQCSSGPGGLRSVPQRAPLRFTPAITSPTSAVRTWSINALADPVAQSGCDTSAPGRGPIALRGGIYLDVTNGAGVTVRTKAFTFAYRDIGAP